MMEQFAAKWDSSLEGQNKRFCNQILYLNLFFMQVKITRNFFPERFKMAIFKIFTRATSFQISYTIILPVSFCGFLNLLMT